MEVSLWLPAELPQTKSPFCSLRVPLNGPAWLFGDNQAVITSSTIPHSQLSRRWDALSHHRVSEASADCFLRFHSYHTKHNPSDVVSKPLDHESAWPLLNPWSSQKVTSCSPKPRGVLEIRLLTWSNRDMDKGWHGISSSYCVAHTSPTPIDRSHPNHFPYLFRHSTFIPLIIIIVELRCPPYHLCIGVDRVYLPTALLPNK